MEVNAEERRKLRLDAMKKRRAAATDEATLKKLKCDEVITDSSAEPTVPVTVPRRSHKPPTKKVDTQVRYDPPPNVQMTEDELKEWRKEQRRIRNRDSAAASRARTKDRIMELEAQNEELMEEVDSLRDRHAKRCHEMSLKIKTLEDQLRHFQAARDLAAVKQDLGALVSSSSEGEGDVESHCLISPTNSPVLSSKNQVSNFDGMVIPHREESSSLSSSANTDSPQQHIISEMISRPACV